MQMYVGKTTAYAPTRTVHLYRTCQTLRMKLEVTAIEVRYPQELDPRYARGPIYRLCAYCKAHREGRTMRTLSRLVPE